ncbi:MAG: hypothetical protein CMJ49_06860 [Planctomycetaceae bacterium]|nr:hypothetical protein [Planctomycetaceae bacterium]
MFNSLLFVYRAPLVLTWIALSVMRDAKLKPVRRGLDVVALVLAFALVSLEVRHWFSGAAMQLSEQNPTRAEMYAYTAAWLVMGVGLIAAGAIRHSAVLRYSSLVLMLIVVVKAFLIDTRHLEGMYRFLSFLGLGVSLLVLAFVYQRFVFPRPLGGKGAVAADDVVKSD